MAAHTKRCTFSYDLGWFKNWHCQLDPNNQKLPNLSYGSTWLWTHARTIRNAQTCIAALHQFGNWGNGMSYGSMWIWMQATSFLETIREEWEVPLRQQSKTFWHVLRIPVDVLANSQAMEKTISSKHKCALGSRILQKWPEKTKVASTWPQTTKQHK